jgi:nicotinamidase-related amidase
MESQPINLAECGLVLIDVDRVSFERHLDQRTREMTLPKLLRLVEHFRERERPVIFVQWGWHKTPYPDLKPRNERENVVIKQSRGAFSTSDLHGVLQKHGIRTCIFTGADTAVCVTATVCGAIDRGYRIVLADDACACSQPDAHDAAMRVMRNMGARVMTTDEILAL